MVSTLALAVRPFVRPGSVRPLVRSSVRFGAAWLVQEEEEEEGLCATENADESRVLLLVGTRVEEPSRCCWSWTGAPALIKISARRHAARGRARDRLDGN